MLYGFEIAVGDVLEPIETKRRDDSDGQEFSQLAFCRYLKLICDVDSKQPLNKSAARLGVLLKPKDIYH
ncbi:MAG: hypothetical protein ACJASB_002958 [Shewanella psychromarinicola]|jgi:hypothetical protein|uniref:hypothetical protein n=1 Tax=Shewanella psychromarinicola TaxID=2487742 RepID=UPI003EED8DFB